MSKKTLFTVLTVLVVFMAVGTFYDLAISEALYNEHNVIAVITNSFAMVPSGIVMVYCAGIVNWFLKNTKLYIPSMLVPVAAGVLEWHEVGKWIGMNKFVWLALGVITGIIVILLFKVIEPHVSKKQFIVAFIFLATATCLTANVELLKNIWGRRRYYSMDNPATQFTPWYIPHPGMEGDIFESFPSGHSSFACLLTFLIYLPEMVNVKLNKGVALGIAFTWVALVMFGRICYGAHFLTDVSFGAIVGVIWCYVGQSCIQKAFSLREKSQTKTN